MMLRYVLIISLIAATSTLLAAPPRFGFQDSTKDELRASAGESPVHAEADAVSTHQQPVPVEQPESPPGAPAETQKGLQANPGDANGATKSANHSNGTPQKPRHNEFWFKARRKPPSPAGQTDKPEGRLVTSDKHHQSTDELIHGAQLHQYRSGYQSFWKTTTSKVMCKMSQHIPHYGFVEFSQGVAQPLQFALYVNQPPAGVGMTRVQSRPPDWRHYSKSRDLGTLEVEAGKQAVTMDAAWSRRLMLEMSEGMQPVMRYWDAADATDDIEIMLSAMNFQESLGLFQRCLGQVLKYDFAKVKRTVVNFHADSSRLRKQAKRQLDEVLELLKTDPGIKQVDIELYSNAKGLVRYNFRLATRRARAVRDYLMKRGIAEDKLLIKVHTKSGNELKKLGYKTTDVHIVLQRKVAK